MTTADLLPHPFRALRAAYRAQSDRRAVGTDPRAARL